MFIQQLYNKGLIEAAYYIESNGEAAIIDPLSDIDTYLQLAAQRKATIKYIFETHFRTNFVSGHIGLSKATGAPVVFGPGSVTDLTIHCAAHGEVFVLGDISIKALHTPGHTLESTCFLLMDKEGNEHAIFTGDTLFVGDVGRPYLSSGNHTINELAAMLYDSLQKYILPLPGNVLVYPAHGPGSKCGKNIGNKTHSTIQAEKENNYALQPLTLPQFIEAVTRGLEKPPNYFAINARINKEGYGSIDEVLKNTLQPLTIHEFNQKAGADMFIVDTRKASDFANGFIPGSISIGLEGKFAEWAGNLLPFNKPLLLVTDPGMEQESVTRLATVGLVKIDGFLQGGFAAWQSGGQPTDMIIEVEADELAMDIPFDERLIVIDVRKVVEFANGHIVGAVNLPLADLTDPAIIADIQDTDNLYVHCASGYRSIIAISLLKRQGIHNLRNVAGGWEKIKEQEGIETEKDPSVLN